MVFVVLYDFRKISAVVLMAFVLLSGCKSAEQLQQEADQANTSSSQVSNQTPVTNTQPQQSSASSTNSGSGAITVNYKNKSSSIKIDLDPNEDQFYLDLRGLAPEEKDSVVVVDSTMMKNRSTDIQKLLAGYRKAQDLFYLGEYRQALAEVDKTIEIQETADAYALKGTIFFMLENVTAARANWTKAVQMDPNMPVPSIPELETLIDEIRGEDN